MSTFGTSEILKMKSPRKVCSRFVFFVSALVKKEKKGLEKRLHPLPRDMGPYVIDPSQKSWVPAALKPTPVKISWTYQLVFAPGMEGPSVNYVTHNEAFIGYPPRLRIFLILSVWTVKLTLTPHFSSKA